MNGFQLNEVPQQGRGNEEGGFIANTRGWGGPLTWALDVENFGSNASRHLGKVTGPGVKRLKS